MSSASIRPVGVKTISVLSMEGNRFAFVGERCGVPIFDTRRNGNGMCLLIAVCIVVMMRQIKSLLLYPSIQIIKRPCFYPMLNIYAAKFSPSFEMLIALTGSSIGL